MNFSKSSPIRSLTYCDVCGVDFSERVTICVSFPRCAWTNMRMFFFFTILWQSIVRAPAVPAQKQTRHRARRSAFGAAGLRVRVVHLFVGYHSCAGWDANIANSQLVGVALGVRTWLVDAHARAVRIDGRDAHLRIPAADGMLENAALKAFDATRVHFSTQSARRSDAGYAHARDVAQLDVEPVEHLLVCARAVGACQRVRSAACWPLQACRYSLFGSLMAMCSTMMCPANSSEIFLRSFSILFAFLRRDGCAS